MITVLQQGHKVFILDIDEEELKHTATVHLRKFASESSIGSAVCNLRDVSDIQAKVKQAAEFFGGHIDVLLNNGGE